MTTKYYTTKDIQKLIFEGKYNEASELYVKLINNLKEKASPLLAETYYEYASFLFDLHEYELSILMFQASYNLGFETERTLRLLYDSFILPNQDEFRKTYEANISKNKKNIVYSYIPSFDELSIDFIPIAEDKFFIFDNDTKQFGGVIDFSKSGLLSYNQVTFNDEFSDLIIADNWNINKIHDYIISAKNRVLYYIGSEPIKSLAFLKLPHITEQYCANIIWIESMEQLQTFFHENNSIYLPHIFFASNNACIDKITQVIEQEHTYRITPDGRNTSSIILTIGIPSYNRGHRALQNIQHLMNLPYDAEIEFIVSNNCSTINTEGYDEIEQIPDSRISYFKFPDKPGQNINFCQPIHMAKGKYVCLMSDEDIINLPSISHYLSVLIKNPEIGFAKGRGILYYGNNTGKIYKKGKDAFLESFLTTNYISGLIYRSDLFHSLNVYSWIAKMIETNFAVKSYSHSCWSALFSLHADYYEDNILLFREGSAEHDVNLASISSSTPSKILSYGTLERRLNQHNGFNDILNQLSCNFDKETYIEAYKKLCRKTFFLMSFVKNQYIENGEDWTSICTEISNCCVDGILKLNISLTKEEQNELVYYIYTYFKHYSENE